MKVTIVGSGYVGLVTAVCFSDLGHEVLCVEKDEDKLKKLQKGMVPFYEPGLDELLKKNFQGKRIHFSRSMEEGVEFSDVIFLCVGTPQGEDGKADLSQIEEASRQIAQAMKSYKLIVEKSTVPVNTHQWVKKTIKRYLTIKDIEFDVASNPEFLREGSAIFDFMNPDRIIIGVESQRAEKLLKELYQYFIENNFKFMVTSPAAAELIKHASNSFLAMKISFINMIADLCEKVGADIQEVADGIGADKRIGRSFLNAGIGYGGSCFPKDVKAFIKIAEEHGLDFGLLKETEKINNQRRLRFIEKIEDVLWISKEKNIAIWGLSFKPNTDDIREAPSIDIVKELNRLQANLFLYDPKAMENFKTIFPESENLHYVKDPYEAVQNSDALIILTEWEEFQSADLRKVKELMRLPIIIDARNIFSKSLMQDLGFEYYSIGR
ncbi:MAG: UDP-glucose/GDP-mannose dehydrogenase family protein [Leptospiraceae bacterium]|nr:UDP-glucose/GDP-mannose dehydrogenase family protein [Leptospiraceae bacterium]MDW7975764.1 UDP-glucose/GDP-mannose dehydrogenase family protein [Leptospiraceae bacterium]